MSISEISKAIGEIAPERAGYRAVNTARTECLPEDAVINGALVTGAYRRWYEGPMIEIITHGGRKFTGTPNHPMLTQRGWVALGDLLESDDLLCDGSSVERSRSPGNVNVQAPPATIGQIFNSISAVVFIQRRRGTKPDFHGDGMESEIDVLLPDGLLRYGRFSEIHERDLNGLLSPSDVRTCFLAAKCAPFTKGVLTKQVCLSHCSQFMASFQNHLLDGCGINAEALGNFRTRFAGMVSRDDLARIGGQPLAHGSVASGHQHSAGLLQSASRNAGQQARLSDGRGVATNDSSDRLGTHTGHVEIDHLLSLNRIELWKGHVYNLSAVAGYFIANGLYTGNTGNMMNYGHVLGIKQTGEETGLQMGKQWLSVQGSTTRDSHSAADGQTVPVDDWFVVGGESARWPGDETLSAGERINCFPGHVAVVGDSLAVMRATYEGTFCEIRTAKGRKITVTENHPILADHGWLAACRVQVGQQLWTALPKVQAERAGEKVHQKPALIEDVFQAFRQGVVSGGGPTVSELRDAGAADFYGDGQAIQGQIEIVWANRNLAQQTVTAADQVGSDENFLGAHVSLANLPRQGSLPLPAVGVDVAASGVPSAPEQLDGERLPVAVCPASPLAVAVAANRNSAFLQAAMQPRPGYSGTNRDPLEWFTGDVCLDQVVEVRTFNAAACHVFDLQTWDGIILASDSISDNGFIVTGNCQCVPGHVVVESIGHQLAASKMLYRGRLVEIVSLSGRRLDVTPNHPVLTTQGWVPAGELKAGMYVLSQRVGKLPADNEKHEPSRIENVFQAIRSAATRIEHRSRLGFEFHGDAENGQGKIEAVVANANLTFPSAAERRQHWKESRLQLAASQLGVAHNGGGGSRRSVDPPIQLSVGLGSQDSVLLQQTMNHWPRHAMIRRDLDLSLAGDVGGNGGLPVKDTAFFKVGPTANRLEVGADFHAGGNKSNGYRLGCATVCGGDLYDGLSLDGIEPDQLVSVRQWDAEFSGHVYDLQTSRGMYLAEGIIVHNCTILSDFVGDELDAEVPDADEETEDYGSLVDVDADIDAEQTPEVDTFVEPQDVAQDVPPPEDEPEPVRPSHPSGIPDLGDLRQVQNIELGGSTGAKLFEDADGNRFVVKYGSSPDHLREEFNAEQAYRALKVAVPDSRLIDEDGRPVKISKFVHGTPLSELEGKAFDDAIKQVRKGFGADALLANWDVAGLSLDNVIVDQSGKVYRIDVGGALRFRAQGGAKGGAFSSHALEIWTLRDEDKNKSGAKVFGDMKFKDIVSSSKAAVKNAPAMLKELRKTDPNLASSLEARSASMKQMVDSAETLAKKDSYSWGYADTFTRHEMKQDAAGLYAAMPKKLEPGRYDNDYLLRDENGKAFDDLRGSEGLGSKLEQFCKANDIPWRVIEKYASDQSGSSWSNGAVANKDWIMRTRKSKPTDYFLGTSDNEGEKEQSLADFKKKAHTYNEFLAASWGVELAKVDEARATQHSFFTNLMRRVDMPGNNREEGYIEAVRTESREVIKHYGLKEGEVGTIRRGAAESFSQTNVFTLCGEELTVQNIPHHRVQAHYAVSRGGGRNGGFLMGDDENELVADTHGLPVGYVGRGVKGEEVERSDFDILKKAEKKPDADDASDDD